MAEYCPQCGAALQESPDDDRLCIVCEWFGDRSETKPTEEYKLPANLTSLDAVRLLLKLYRTACMCEAQSEAAYANGHGSRGQLYKVKDLTRKAGEKIVGVIAHIIRRGV